MSGVTEEDLILEGVRASSAQYPLPEGVTFAYGTAGFRCKADLLPAVAYRIGVLAAIRAKCLGRTMGVMVTASHNPPQDNGLKVVEPGGEMLLAEWEVYATALANTPTECLPEVLVKLCGDVGVGLCKKGGGLVLGRDSRESGPAILQAVREGAHALNCKVEDIGECTTPQLHWVVKQGNLGLPASIPAYYTHFASSFKHILGEAPANKIQIKVDCANGVGALSLKALAPHLADYLEVSVCNDGSTGELNHQCGADFVKLTQNAPQGVTCIAEEHCYTIDGDADRSMFFYTKDHQFRLLDGDKISCLFADFISDLISKAGLSISLGVVQTAYANGSSTCYLRARHIPVACVPTGVKHLHAHAHKFGVGVYFEANGHGTVLFSDNTVEMVSKCTETGETPEQRSAAATLCSFINLINPSVGDAITNILAIETVLRLRKMTALDWDCIYTDLPYRQLKISIRDRDIIKTTDAERKIDSPDGLQLQIDNLIAGFEGARCFVRPSGTENCVRVHAEGRTQRDADSLANVVGVLVQDFTEGLYSKL